MSSFPFRYRGGSSNLTNREEKALSLVTCPCLGPATHILAPLQGVIPRSLNFLFFILSFVSKCILCPNDTKTSKFSYTFRIFLFFLWRLPHSPPCHIKLLSSNKCIYFLMLIFLFSVYFTDPAAEPRRAEKNFLPLQSEVIKKKDEEIWMMWQGLH